MSAPPLSARKRERLGYLCGVGMAVSAALAFSTARAGILGGLSPIDLIFARFVVAGLIMLPFLIHWGLPPLAGIGLKRSLVLTALGGLPFALLQTGGYAFAPLAHGAVIAPSTVTVVSTIVAAVFLHERLGLGHLAGATIALLGIVLISWEGLNGASGPRAWIGDLMFFASSVLWAGFTVLLRHWRLNAVRATAVVTVLSMAITVPTYLVCAGPAHLAALPLGVLAMQGVVQGGIQAVFGMMAFSQAVVLLGVSRAVLFPTIVPALSVLIGIPIVGEIPSVLQITGLVLVTIGLLASIGVFNRLAGRLVRRRGA